MEPQGANQKSSVKNIIIISASVLVVAGLGFYFFGNSRISDDKKVSLVTTQKLVSEDQQKISDLYEKLKNSSGLSAEQLSIMNMVAYDISIKNPDTSLMQYSQALGYKFKTSWGIGTISEKTKNSTTVKQLEFKNGKKILLYCSSQTPREELTTVDAQFGAPLPKEDTDQILRFLGLKADSGFDYTNLLLSSNIESVKSSDSFDSAEALSKLLILKSVSQPSAKQPYRFSIGNVKGFQYGDYSASQSTTIIVFTTNNTRCDVMTNDNLTQSDADIMISTFSAI